MNLKMQFDFKNIKKINIKQAISSMDYAWQKINTTLFFIFLFSVIALGGYIWQKSLYEAEWSYERKQEYMASQDKRILFKENDFNKTIADIQSRKEESEKQYESIRDIFKPY
ncbi:MAG TPA: hypothetical protein P5323_00005 [Candidatus Moranbacteria bacterium]|jgi:hypothetical protein|nr:hypothetical protein [Candidatus Moranbacteria bacterium]HRY27509.1 hypothetical protein [Candidatus Moranbacteria bacterium]HSA07950.1 hypothetical protein [Candidatus Moranbacteria bacterium]